MKLDTTKVYSLEGMSKTQIIVLFSENGILLSPSIIFKHSDLALSDDVIYFNEKVQDWNWLLGFSHCDVIKVIDLIN